ncbi:MAG: hypothetical protein IT475_10810 [Aquimonas sp.]|nr:hypothetical protein [Aquimonas sp.]
MSAIHTRICSRHPETSRNLARDIFRKSVRGIEGRTCVERSQYRMKNGLLCALPLAWGFRGIAHAVISCVDKVTGLRNAFTTIASDTYPSAFSFTTSIFGSSVYRLLPMNTSRLARDAGSKVPEDTMTTKAKARLPWRALRLITVLGLANLLTISIGQAAVVCVSNTQQYLTALRAAESNGVDDTILVKSVTLSFPSGQRPGYRPKDSDAFTSIEVIGGADDCTSNPVSASHQTTLYPVPSDPLKFDVNGGFTHEDGTVVSPFDFGGKITIRNLSIVDLNVSAQVKMPGVTLDSNRILATAKLELDRVRLIGFDSDAPVLDLNFGPSGTAVVRNSLIAENLTSSNNGVIFLRTDGNAVIRFSNNSVNDNVSPRGTVYASGTIDFANNAIADNQILSGGLNEQWNCSSTENCQGITLRNNHFGSYFSSNGSVFQDVGTSIGDAVWTLNPIYFSRTPKRGSPLVDSGVTSVAGGLGTKDILGGVRVAGATVDRGAVELGQLFANGFE